MDIPRSSDSLWTSAPTTVRGGEKNTMRKKRVFSDGQDGHRPYYCWSPPKKGPCCTSALLLCCGALLLHRRFGGRPRPSPGAGRSGPKTQEVEVSPLEVRNSVRCLNAKPESVGNVLRPRRGSRGELFPARDLSLIFRRHVCG